VIKPDTGTLKWLVFCGICATATQLTFALGVNESSASQAGLFIPLVPALLTCLHSFTGDEKVTCTKILSMTTAFVGVVILASGSSMFDNTDSHLSVTACIYFSSQLLQR